MLDKKTKSTAKQQYKYANSFESPKDAPVGIAKAFMNDVAKQSTIDMWDQILGTGAYETAKQHEGGELLQGQEITFVKQEAPKPRAETGIDYRREILRPESHMTEGERSVQMQVAQILDELKRIIATSQELQAQYKTIAMETIPQKAGEYHISFFSFILSIVKSARVKVESSANFMATLSNKKAKRSYWNMFKKHGTTFGLSNERNTATQTG